MSHQPITPPRDTDLKHLQAALERAAQRAREIAAQTGTAIVISRHGVIEHIYPAQNQSAPPAPQTVQEPTPPYSGKV